MSNGNSLGLRPSRPSLQRLTAEVLGRQRFLAVLGLMLAVALVYWPSSVALERLWTDTRIREYTHGFAVLLVSLWLLHERRGRLEAQPLRPQRAALALLVLLSAVWVIASRAAIQDLHVLVLPALLIAASLALFGWPVTRLTVFPLAFLYFTLPFWSDSIGPLQHASEKAVAALIWLTGLPAYLQGDLIHVPAGTLEIAGGCSGSHFLVVGLALAALYGELREDSLVHRLGWIALMGGIALAANWLRIYTIAAAAYATDMRTFLVTVDHYWFGWLVFAAGFVAFLWIAGRVGRPPHADSAGESSVPLDAARGSGVSWTRWSCVLLSLAALPALSYALDIGRRAPPHDIDIAWSAAPRGWTGPLPDDSRTWHPVFQNSTVAQMRRYVDGGGRVVELYAVAYRLQRHGSKLVMYGNSVLGDTGSLHVLSQRIVHTSTSAWREEIVADSRGSKWVFWLHYRIGERTFAHAVISQVTYGLMDLSGNPLSSIVAIRAGCDHHCDAARARLAAVAASAPEVRWRPVGERL